MGLLTLLSLMSIGESLSLSSALDQALGCGSALSVLDSKPSSSVNPLGPSPNSPRLPLIFELDWPCAADSRLGFPLVLPSGSNLAVSAQHGV